MCEFEMYLTPHELSMVQKRPLSEIFDDIKNKRLDYILTDDGIRIPSCFIPDDFSEPFN
ncbi:MAG: hypothetical protein HFG42_13635 [Lachnospiraceae bacterium]|nr:hypothetical protein [Lachnospiraceae bacterium]